MGRQCFIPGTSWYNIKLYGYDLNQSPVTSSQQNFPPTHKVIYIPLFMWSFSRPRCTCYLGTIWISILSKFLCIPEVSGWSMSIPKEVSESLSSNSVSLLSTFHNLLRKLSLRYSPSTRYRMVLSLRHDRECFIFTLKLHKQSYNCRILYNLNNA